MKKIIKILLFPVWFIFQTGFLFDEIFIGGLKIMFKDFKNWIDEK